jgi:hypothetical protein
MEIYVLNYSINSADYTYSEHEYFSSLENLEKCKKILIEKDEVRGELASSSKTGQYLWCSYIITVDSLLGE